MAQHGPRKVLSLKDEKGQRTVTLNMAYGLSVKWAITPDGETIFCIDRHGEVDESDSKERASSARPHQSAVVSVEGLYHSAPAPQQKPQPGATATIDPPKRGRGRPRIRPIMPEVGHTFGDFLKESLEEPRLHHSH